MWRRIQQDRGSAAVELALMMVFLATVGLGVIELTSATYTRIGIEEAVQDAVIYAAYNPDDPGGVSARAMEASSRVTLQPSDIVVTCLGDRVRVTITHDHQYITDFLDPLLGPSLSMSSMLTGEILNETACVAS